MYSDTDVPHDPVAVTPLVWVGRSMPDTQAYPFWGVLSTGWTPAKAAEKVGDGWAVVCPDFTFAAEVLRLRGADEPNIERRILAAQFGIVLDV